MTVVAIVAPIVAVFFWCACVMGGKEDERMGWK